MAKKSTTTRTTKTAKTDRPVGAGKNGTAKAVLPLNWTATEYVPRKRWWWFLGFALIMFWLAGAMTLLHDWYALALVITVTITVFVLYLPKPRRQHWSLDKATLTVNGTVIHLENYRAFTIEELPGTKTVPPRLSLTLLPKRRFGWAIPIYLPDDDETGMLITESLELSVPYSDAASYQAFTRQINRLVRWLRLG